MHKRYIAGLCGFMATIFFGMQFYAIVYRNPALWKACALLGYTYLVAGGLIIFGNGIIVKILNNKPVEDHI